MSANQIKIVSDFCRPRGELLRIDCAGLPPKSLVGRRRTLCHRA